MNTLKRILYVTAAVLISFCANAQEEGKKKMEQDFEKFKQNREIDFQNFKKQREEELKKMAQEYQDYYNSMMGLKKYYVENKDTAKANVVDDIIKFEESVSYVFGKRLKVTEPVVVTPTEIKKEEVKQPDQEKPHFIKSNNNTEQVIPKEEEVKVQKFVEETKMETTFIPLPSDGNTIPILTPLPKAKSKITSPYGMRLHPTLKRNIKHNGVDFGSGRNTEVFAAANGKVVLAEFNRSFGNYIIVEHKDGTSSLYAHLETINVSKGNTVKKGDLIGYTGSTGRSSGAHLHYEVRVSGIPVNPEGYLKEYK